MPGIKHRLKSVFTASALAAGGAYFSSAAGCISKGITELRSSFTDEECMSADRCQIFVFSNQLLALPLLPDPAHNGLLFVGSHEGDFTFSINGSAINRRTGEMESIGGNSDALLVNEHYTRSDSDITVTEIYNGSFDDVMKKLRITLDASCFINKQNLAYDLFEFSGTAQNSNSVAYSLMRAMGFELPEYHKKYMMPGHGRLLLPSGWRSFYEDWEPPVKDRAFQIWHAKQLYENVKILAYKSADEKIAPGRPLFFNPDKPFTEYTPVIISEPEAQWRRQCKLEAAAADAARVRRAQEWLIMQYNADLMMKEFELRP